MGQENEEMTPGPDVTVVLPVYNGMPYLPDAVNSVLEQTLSDFNILIIDDGSTDGTGAYLESINDKRVKILGQPNQGLGATLNRAIKMCDTEFLARMDADDLSSPRRLEKQLNYLRENPGVGAVGSQVTYFIDKDRFGLGPALYCDHDDIYSSLLRMEHALCHASLMFRTSVLKAVGGYRIKGIGEDWDLFLRVAESARVANLDEALYMMRLHDKSIVWSQWRKVRMRYAYAVECARLRSEGLPEISLEEFAARHGDDSLWRRVAGRIDSFSNDQYRGAMVNILNGKKTAGYLKMLLASFCAPSRSLGRIRRELRKIAER